MEQYIDKSAVVAEIERIKKEECPTDTYEGRCKLLWFEQFLSFINNLEVKEVYECNNVDLNPLFEEMGVEPDSRIALMFKNAFYKAVDNYLDKKENKLWNSILTKIE